MKPDKRRRYNEFYEVPGVTDTSLFDKLMSRIAFEGAELCDRLEDRLDEHEDAAHARGIEYKPGLKDKVAIGIVNLLNGPL